MEKTKGYKTIIKIWSRVGHAPLSKRKGDVCDLLAEKEIKCNTPADARNEVIKMIDTTMHGVDGHFRMLQSSGEKFKTGWIKQ